MVVGFIIHMPHDLLLWEIVVGDRGSHRATDILLAEFALIARDALAITLARIDARHGLEALGIGTCKGAAEPWKHGDGK
jgi:hypothetical protein